MLLVNCSLANFPVQFLTMSSSDAISAFDEKMFLRLYLRCREPTRGQNLLDLFYCNKPSLVKTCFISLVFRTTVLF